MRFKLFGITWDFSEAIRLLSTILNPTYWIQIYPQNKKWDKMLRTELNNPIFTEKGGYTIKLNGKEIWISNYPYSYGYAYLGKIKGLPTRRTRILLRNKIREYENNQ